jgi:hypothetical protein
MRQKISMHKMDRSIAKTDKRLSSAAAMCVDVESHVEAGFGGAIDAYHDEFR